MRIGYKKRFLKKLKKSSPKLREQFQEHLDMFLEDKFNPILENHSVDKAYPGCRSINVTGNYRALFQEVGDVVIFVELGTHLELYR